MTGIVLQVVPGKRSSFSHNALPPSLLDHIETGTGDGFTTLTHRIEAGFHGAGRILDPLLRGLFVRTTRRPWTSTPESNSRSCATWLFERGRVGSANDFPPKTRNGSAPPCIRGVKDAEMPPISDRQAPKTDAPGQPRGLGSEGPRT